MRIKKLQVSNLFGEYNYNIDIKYNKRITILHGPNGSGKTSILKFLDGFFNLKLFEIIGIPFDDFTIYFDNGSILKIIRNENPELFQLSDSEQKLDALKIIYNKNSTKLEYKIKYKTIVNERDYPIRDIERNIPGLLRIAPRRWHYVPEKIILTLEDILRRFGDELPSIGQTVLSDEPDWLLEIRNILKIHFIDTKRLYNFNLNDNLRRFDSDAFSIISSVNQYSSELIRIIQSFNNKYTTLSQELDKTLWIRLVNETGFSSGSKKENISKKLEELINKRKKLIEAGLLDGDIKDESIEKLPEDSYKLYVISVYIEDAFKKLNVFDEIRTKIELFKEIVNNKFQSKIMKIDKQNGIKIITNNGRPINPSKLSSGEQHELVLLFELLFKNEKESLILIDEPEISLHISWQKMFLDDLLKIANISPFDAIVATHSTYIVNDKQELLVPLTQNNFD